MVLTAAYAQGGREIPAGPTITAHTRFREVSTWDATKERLEDFMRGYVDKDVTGAMKALSRDFTQDASILRNALLRDLQQQTDIHVDLELLQYTHTAEGTTVSLNWFRTATLQSTGASVVGRGSARVLHDRHDGYGIKAWLGASPFGQTDAAWLRQAAVGDPTLTSGFVQTQSFSALDSNPGDPESLAIDFEGPGGNVTRFRQNSCPGCAPPPQDLVVNFVQVFPHLAVAVFSADKSPEVQLGGDNAIPPGVIDCPGASGLEDIGRVDPGNLLLFKTSAGVLNVFPGGSGSIVFAVVTHENNYAVLQVDVRSTGGFLVDATLRWRLLGPDPAGGTPGGGSC